MGKLRKIRVSKEGEEREREIVGKGMGGFVWTACRGREEGLKGGGMGE
jgi:hypothetical protein